jgi:hypothetical protein
VGVGAAVAVGLGVGAGGSAGFFCCANAGAAQSVIAAHESAAATFLKIIV